MRSLLLLFLVIVKMQVVKCDVKHGKYKKIRFSEFMRRGMFLLKISLQVTSDY